MAIKVLLVDDHRLVREALGDALRKEPELEIVGETGDAATAFECVRSLAPDVVVLDIGLPDQSGIEVARALKQRAGSDVKIVALSFHTDRRFVTAMLRAGASGYVTKSSSGTELVRAIRAVSTGQVYVCPEAAAARASANGDGPADESPLTRREHEVLRLIANGVRSPAIADELGIRLGTVEVHRRNIMRKLGLASVADLTRYAIRSGRVQD